MWRVKGQKRHLWIAVFLGDQLALTALILMMLVWCALMVSSGFFFSFASH